EFVAFARGEVEGFVAGYDVEGNDVPDVDGHEIDGEEVELVGCVAVASGADDVAGVGAFAAEGGALDLDAKEAAAVFDGDGVAGGVSVRAGDGEAAVGGAGHEAELGPFS